MPIEVQLLEEHSEEWSRKYSGSYIAVVDGEVVAAEATPSAAYNKAKKIAGGKEIAVFYMATDKEMVTLLIL